MTRAIKTIFIDITAWFSSRAQFQSVILNQWELVTSSLVVYEFLKIIEQELEIATQKANNNRYNLLMNLKGRFPELLSFCNVKILPLDIKVIDLNSVYKLIKKHQIDVGDALNYLLLQRKEINYILSDDKDWNRLPNVTVVDDELLRKEKKK
ncbi:hypothetical protein ES705_24604 [subsurface metagenome]